MIAGTWHAMTLMGWDFWIFVTFIVTVVVGSQRISERNQRRGR